ncbi:MAG: carboxymuconolactone decarboxylase family protein [Ilumatobacteraceae bacterium]
MEARMKNPVAYLPDTLQALMTLGQSTREAGVPSEVIELAHLRASQINGCSWCVHYGFHNAKKAGETDDRLATVAVWRESPYFTDAERAALALTEAMTRLSDRADAVPDDVWNEAAAHFGEKELAALVISIATTNLYNRLNVTTRQPIGAGWK